MVDGGIEVFHVSAARAVQWVRQRYSRVTALLVGAELMLVAGTMATTPAARHWSFWSPGALIFSVGLAFLARAVGRTGRRVATYQLTIGPNVLRIVQQGLVPTEIFRHEVTRII